MDKAEQILDKHINEDDLNFIFHENKQLWQELLNAVNEALCQTPVSVNEVAVCSCQTPDICQDTSDLVYCFECKKQIAN